MKIIMLVGKSTGGIGVYVGSLTQALRQQGHQVRICTDALTAKHFDYEYVDLLWPVFPRSWHSFKLVFNRIRQARKVLRSADVVHAHGYQAGFYAAYLFRRMVFTPPLVLSLHNSLTSAQKSSWWVRILRRMLFSRCQLVTGSSSDLVRGAQNHGASQVALDPIPSPKVSRFLENPPLDRRQRLENWKKLAARERINNRGQLVLSVGRIEPSKQYHLLIQAMDYLAYPATTLVIGSGDLSLLTNLRSKGNEAKVSFLGARSNLNEWFDAATVLVVTSKWEARSLVVQEAMAHGLPVIAPSVGGLVDLLGDSGVEESAGILVEPDNPSAIGDAMWKLLSDPSSWYEYQKRGRERAGAWPNINQLGRRWTGIYESLIKSKKRRGDRKDL